MKSTHSLLLLLAFSLTILTRDGVAAEDPELRNVMKAKLVHLQSVLEGLALEDFDRIRKSGQALGTLSRAAAWNIHKTPEYVKFSRDFQEVADSLVADANAKKLESVALDYVQLTMLCVKCHTHSRKQGVARIEGPLPPAASSTASR